MDETHVPDGHAYVGNRLPIRVEEHEVSWLHFIEIDALTGAKQLACCARKLHAALVERVVHESGTVKTIGR